MRDPGVSGKKNIAAVLGAMSVFFIAVFLLSFCMGRFSVPLSQVVRILADELLGFISRGSLGLTKTWNDTMRTAVINIRLPRIVLGSLVGCCLSAAGCAYQGVFQNPMAAPDILGASSGAACGAAVAILFGASGAVVTGSAFALSMLTVFLVFIIGQKAPGKKVVNLILAGIIISSLFQSGTSYVKLAADPSDQLPAITYWLMGSLSGSKNSQLLFAVIPMAIGIIPLICLRWKLNVLTLGDDEARTMGVNASAVRLVAAGCATLITAASVSVSGMIGWVGLVIPHLCRRLVGNDNRYLIPASMITGAAFLVLVDDVSRNLLVTEIPIGILTSFIGAPFFIYLMFGRSERYER